MNFEKESVSEMTMLWLRLVQKTPIMSTARMCQGKVVSIILAVVLHIG